MVNVSSRCSIFNPFTVTIDPNRYCIGFRSLIKRYIEELDFIIPGNDDAIRAVKLIVSKMADAVIEAKQGEAVYSDADVATEAEDIEEVAADAE